MKGILLAGGTGSRLHPLTLTVNKHLLPVAGTPMILHPLTLLLRAGIRELLIVTTPRDRAAFARLLGDGKQWGCAITYAEQPGPSGVPDAIALARDWSAGQQVCVVLGDNIFVGSGVDERLRQAWHANRGASVFSCAVPDPRPYGVVITTSTGDIVDLNEKPADILAGARAVPGLYVYDHQVFSAITELSAGLGRPPDVTDINRWYWTRGLLTVHPLGSGIAWCDAGTHDTLGQATRMVEDEETRTGRVLACPDESAWRHGWITDVQLRRRLSEMEAGPYAEHLRRVLAGGRSGVVTTS